MKYLQTLFMIVPIIFLTEKTLGQGSSMHPFAGVSINFLGVSSSGFGAEVGLNFGNFYVGVEYGIYDISLGSAAVFLPLNYYDTHPYGVEQYYSINGGIVINKTYWFGIVILLSVQPFLPHGYRGNYDAANLIDKIWLDAGPDIGIQTSKWFRGGLLRLVVNRYQASRRQP